MSDVIRGRLGCEAEKERDAFSKLVWDDNDGGGLLDVVGWRVGDSEVSLFKSFLFFLFFIFLNHSIFLWLCFIL